MTTNEKAVEVLAHPTAQRKAQHPKDTKINRILNILRSGISLNRFEAARLGDSCLNSTVAVLRAEGFNIVGVWEEVPNRFGGKTRCKRYRYVAGS
ncbi:MAG: helix-turn-helix domain-containing protein [Burkholderiaceae bacterium]